MIRAVIFDCFGVILVRGRFVVDEQLLSYIKNELKSRCKLGLLSNAGPRSYKMEDGVGEEGWGLFDDKVLSYEVGLVKPDPEIYRLAASRLGVKPDECVFVDDGEHNVLAAEEVGMRGVVYRDFESFRRDLDKMFQEERDLI